MVLAGKPVKMDVMKDFGRRMRNTEKENCQKKMASSINKIGLMANSLAVL